MKILPLLLFAAALLFAGCSTVQSRIEEKSAIFNSLDPQTQANIRQGIVGVGYTQDMVYMAVGRPDETREKTSADGQETTWIYNDYWQDYQGRQLVGYHRRVYYDREIKAYRSYIVPVHAEFYRDRVEETARIIFKNGKVTAIEQRKE